MDSNDNELAYLEAIHLFVEVLGARHQSNAELCIIIELGPRLILLERVRVGSCIQFLQSMNTFNEGILSEQVLQVYAILDEVFLAGEIEETSKDVVLARLEQLEKLE